MRLFARLAAIRRLGTALGIAALLIVSLVFSPTAQAHLPANPQLVLTGIEHYQSGGMPFTRYRFNVANKEEFPPEMFESAPDLPPCGLNTRASRSWVDIFDEHGKRLNGFCALDKPQDLGTIWFALPDGVLPPSWVYIEINDRRTNTKYKSNLAETAP